MNSTAEVDEEKLHNQVGNITDRGSINDLKRLPHVQKVTEQRQTNKQKKLKNQQWK